MQYHDGDGSDTGCPLFRAITRALPYKMIHVGGFGAAKIDGIYYSPRSIRIELKDEIIEKRVTAETQLIWDNSVAIRIEDAVKVDNFIGCEITFQIS